MRKKAKSGVKAELRRGKRTVSCQVSERYISYKPTDPKEIGFGYPVVMYVRKDNSHEDKPDRNICEMVFSLEDLEVMVAQLRSDISVSQ